MNDTNEFIKKHLNKIVCGDALQTLKRFPDECIDCIVTSPPYYALRDYGRRNQIGLESSFNEYLNKLLAVFDEVKRALKPQGTCWVVLGDTYGGSSSAENLRKSQHEKRKTVFQPNASSSANTLSNLPRGKDKYKKSLLQIPSRFSVAMIERGWLLRNEVIWHKPNVQPSSVTDRFTVDFEKIYFFAKNSRYYFNQQFEPLGNKERLQRRFLNPDNAQKYRDITFSAINQNSIEGSRVRMLERGARNKRCVWKIGTSNYSGGHYATFPEKLVETPIQAGCPRSGVVLDPFIGSGTTALTAKRFHRKFIGIELNSEYAKIARSRLANQR